MMSAFDSIDPDRYAWRPSLVLLLTDAVTGSRRLVGKVLVRSGRDDAVLPDGVDEATFVFDRLPDGAHTVAVRSGPETPYYAPVDIALTLPLTSERWTAYPDRALADPDLPLDDPGQPAAYRAQRALAALQPTTAYPFPAGSTLVRGAILAAGRPVAGATVHREGEARGYTTAEDGEFVLFFDRVVGRTEAATIVASAAGRPDGHALVELVRGAAVTCDVELGP